MSTGNAAEGGRKARELRGALLSDITEGKYREGDLLPAQRDLAARHNVSRDTVQRVLGVLAKEGWIETRQGMGSVVLRTETARPSARANAVARRVALGPLIASAFTARDITLDVFTLTSEVLYTHMCAQEELIRAGEISPATITLRMLVPSDDVRLPYPHAPSAPDDDRPRKYLQGIRKYHIDNLQRRLEELGRDIGDLDVMVEIRRVVLVPYSKLYVLNGVEVVTGPYEPCERRITLDDETTMDVIDVMGFDSNLTHCVMNDDPNSLGSRIASSWKSWFDSTWRHPPS
ncbi:GntR family transcriptional regulator [Streptomyces canus]|uniref:winged helix-turn-helix domain-containing protein n=1 Tax=Streptomyces canus TaxID=58343 RepID=UPI0036E0E87E